MFGSSFNPPLAMPLTLVTQTLVIQGNLTTRMRRIEDVLNEPGAEHLMLSGAAFMELGSRRVIAGPAVAQVQLDDILFVHANGPLESGSSENRTSKQPVRATLLVAPFTIEGQIHLGYEPDVSTALDGVNGRFVPVTAARYWAYSVAESPNHVDLVLVCRLKTHIVVAANVEWRTEMAPERGGGSHPW
jgi:hypothetical protein